MLSFPQTPKADFFLEGPQGLLQAASSWPINQQPKAIMIICHPHPLYAGTMNNKVVSSLARSADHLGLASLKFNFRGVGKSEGHYGHSIGECDDLRAVIAWVRKVLPELPLCLAGFSFGSFIAANLAAEQSIAALISIAPAVNHQDYQNLSSITAPWLIVQGDQDEVVPYADVAAWFKKAPSSARLITLERASHFFHGRLLELQATVESFLAEVLHLQKKL